MLTFVCFKWAPRPGYRSTYGPETVNVWASMIRRHYPGAHECVCVTEDPAGLEPGIRIVPLWEDYAALPSPHGARHPSCYRRLKLFAREAADLIGPRFVALDLDLVMTGDLAPLFDREADVMLWRDPDPRTRYNGSLLLLTAGSRTWVWDTFDPATSPQLASQAGFQGSDQAWISYALGPDVPTWTTADGVYSYQRQVKGKSLPANARIVIWHGRDDPWGPQGQRLGWVQEHYH